MRFYTLAGPVRSRENLGVDAWHATLQGARGRMPSELPRESRQLRGSTGGARSGASVGRQSERSRALIVAGSCWLPLRTVESPRKITLTTTRNRSCLRSRVAV